MAQVYKIKTDLTFTIDAKDYILVKGTEVELPSKNEYIESLAGQGLIELVQAEKKEVKTTNEK